MKPIGEIDLLQIEHRRLILKIRISINSELPGIYVLGISSIAIFVCPRFYFRFFRAPALKVFQGQVVEYRKAISDKYT